MKKTMKKMVAMVLMVSVVGMFSGLAFAESPDQERSPILRGIDNAIPLSDQQMEKVRGAAALYLNPWHFLSHFFHPHLPYTDEINCRYGDPHNCHRAY